MPSGRQRAQVAGAVEPGARRAEGVGHEALGGQRRPAQVATGQAVAADVQLAGDADRHAAAPRASSTYQRCSRIGRPIGTIVRWSVVRRPGTRHDHGGLGRAVRVDQSRRGQAGRATVRHATRQHLTGHPELTGQPVRLRGVDLRRPATPGAAGVMMKRSYGPAAAAAAPSWASVELLREQGHRLAGHQRPPEVGDRQVEGDRWRTAGPRRRPGGRPVAERSVRAQAR